MGWLNDIVNSVFKQRAWMQNAENAVLTGAVVFGIISIILYSVGSVWFSFTFGLAIFGGIIYLGWEFYKSNFMRAETALSGIIEEVEAITT